MTVYITAVTPGTAKRHDRIGGIRWLDSGNSTSKTMTTEQAVAWVRNGNTLWVAGSDGAVEVQVVAANTPYLRTVANGEWSDNLLSLPHY